MWKCDRWQNKCESPAHSLTCWTKKWKPASQETQTGEIMRWLYPLFPCRLGGEGVKWLMHLILDPISKPRRPAATKNLMIAAYRISAMILFLTQRDPIRAICQCQSNCHILHTAGNMNPLHSHSSLASLSLHNYRPSLRHAQELSFSLQWTL